jgi:hypothetical protein
VSDVAPEDELCLLLARAQLSPEVLKRTLELLDTPLRWGPLLKRATDHQVFPLLYRSLRTVEFYRVPGEARAQLATAFRVNAVRNQFLAGELARVLLLLGEAGVRVIPLKGITLAESLYGDPAFRVCWDIDILVPASEVLRGRRLLLAQGYTSPFPEDFFVRHQFCTSADCPLLPQIQRDAVSYLLEVHWTLMQHSFKDEEAMQDLWSQVHPQGWFGIQAYNLSPEWQFLYLAWHAAYHKWQTLKWLADIHEICVSTSIDWQQVREKAERFDLESVTGSTLAVCSTLFGTPTPPGFSHEALPAEVQLFPSSLAPSEAWKAPLFYPRLLKQPFEKLRWFAEMLFVARLADVRFLPLPPSLSLLYYAVRPLRLSCKWLSLCCRAGYRRLRRALSLPTST